MKIIILAAGQGKRLLPLTNDKPKCMVNFHNKPLIDYILQSVDECNVNKVAIVCGYKSKTLRKYLSDKKIKFFENKNYRNTNMVSTFFCAKDFMDDDIIISYSDIIYKSEILEKLIKSKNDFSVVIDQDWRDLWSTRMENPLNDAETLKIKNGKIVELGKKTNRYSDIEGQYIGLIKIKKKIIKKIINFYDVVQTDLSKDNKKSFDNMYMTTFIQMIIDKLLDVYPTYVRGGWFEIDSINDLQQMEKRFSKF